MEEDKIKSIAESFAKLLDCDDFDGAAQLIAKDCVYKLQGELIVGRLNIIDSFRSHSVWAKNTFEEVQYEHQLESVDGNKASILFIDDVSHSEHKLDYRCRVNLTIDGERGITRIKHEELPGEKDKLLAFFRTTGLKQPS